MTTNELSRRLLAEGCNPANYAINTRSYDGFCLLHNGRGWAVFYSERGQDQEPIFVSLEEAEACQYFFDFVLSMEHRHLIGFLRSEPAARALQGRLAAAGITPHPYRVLYAKNDYRYGVSVIGKDIFRARALLGAVPVADVEDGRLGFWTRLWRRLG